MSEPKDIISGEELQNALQNQLNSDLYLKLITHAFYRFKYRYGMKKSNADLKELAYKMVHEILDKVFIEQTRKWYAKSRSDLGGFLRSAIDSHINNYLNKDKAEIITENEEFARLAQNKESQMHSISAVEELDDLIESILTKLKVDDEEMIVFHCIKDGLITAKEIRIELGLSEEKFSRIWRRVQKKRNKLKVELKKYGY